MLTAQRAASLVQALAKHRFKRGEAIVEQGKKFNALPLLLTGRARVISGDPLGR